jgi:hypothetical protein
VSLIYISEGSGYLAVVVSLFVAEKSSKRRAAAIKCGSKTLIMQNSLIDPLPAEGIAPSFDNTAHEESSMPSLSGRRREEHTKRQASRQEFSVPRGLY